MIYIVANKVPLWAFKDSCDISKRRLKTNEARVALLNGNVSQVMTEKTGVVSLLGGQFLRAVNYWFDVNVLPETAVTHPILEVGDSLLVVSIDINENDGLSDEKLFLRKASFFLWTVTAVHSPW